MFPNNTKKDPIRFYKNNLTIGKVHEADHW